MISIRHQARSALVGLSFFLSAALLAGNAHAQTNVILADPVKDPWNYGQAMEQVYNKVHSHQQVQLKMAAYDQAGVKTFHTFNVIDFDLDRSGFSIQSLIVDINGKDYALLVPNPSNYDGFHSSVGEQEWMDKMGEAFDISLSDKPHIKALTDKYGVTDRTANIVETRPGTYQLQEALDKTWAEELMNPGPDFIPRLTSVLDLAEEFSQLSEIPDLHANNGMFRKIDHRAIIIDAFTDEKPPGSEIKAKTPLDKSLIDQILGIDFTGMSHAQIVDAVELDFPDIPLAQRVQIADRVLKIRADRGALGGLLAEGLGTGKLKCSFTVSEGAGAVMEWGMWGMIAYDYYKSEHTATGVPAGNPMNFSSRNTARGMDCPTTKPHEHTLHCEHDWSWTDFAGLPRDAIVCTYYASVYENGNRYVNKAGQITTACTVEYYTVRSFIQNVYLDQPNSQDWDRLDEIENGTVVYSAFSPQDFVDQLNMIFYYKVKLQDLSPKLVYGPEGT